MKKSILISGCCALSALILSGCSAVNTSQGAYTADVSVSKEFTPVVDLQKEVVSGEAQVNCLFGIFTWGVSSFADNAFVKSTGPSFSITANPMDVAKQGATYNALDAANADMLLAAKYVIDTKDYVVFKQINCTATGFPGVIKDVK